MPVLGCPHCAASIQVSPVARVSYPPTGGDYDFCDSHTAWACGGCSGQVWVTLRVWLDGSRTPELHEVTTGPPDPEVQTLPRVADRASLEACLGQRCLLRGRYTVEQELGWGGRAEVLLTLADGTPLWMIDSEGRRCMTWASEWRQHRDREVVLRGVVRASRAGHLGVAGSGYLAAVAPLTG